MKTSTSGIVEGVNRLGWRLAPELVGSGNSFFSPLSIAIALIALRAGARGTTAQEFSDLLGMDADGSREVGALLESLAHRRGRVIEGDAIWMSGEDPPFVEKELFQLSISTGCFVHESYDLRPSFRNALETVLHADLGRLDFEASAGPEHEINGWISAKTHGRIPSLVSALPPATRLVVANAIWFSASWESAFDRTDSRPRPFHAPGGDIEVRMMRKHREAGIRYGEFPGLRVRTVEIPYQGNVSMIVMLPHEARLEEVEATLSAEKFQKMLTSLDDRDVALELPSLTTDAGYDLGPTLRKLGLRDAFDIRRADFGEATPDPEGLFLSEVVHRAYVRVDEEGTEASAATTMSMLARSIRPEPIPFVVDRPFLFVIRDKESAVNLFLGRIQRPNS